MSIFAKDCPRCGETNAAYAVSCRCGFAFNSVDHVEEEESDISVTIQEEELYLEYLRARAQQAEENAKRAARAATEQPANKVAASQSQQAELAAEQAKAELEQQRARMKVAMNVLVDDNSARQWEPASTAPARPQSPMSLAGPASPPANAATTPPTGEPKQPAPTAAKPTAASPLAERKEPVPAPVKSPAPAVKGGETMPPASAKPPQDLNKYTAGPDNARVSSAANSTGQVTGHPAHGQLKMPIGHSGARPETKVHASAPTIANKAVPPTAKTNVTQAVPTKTENAPASKQRLPGNASTAAKSAPPARTDAGAGLNASPAVEASGKSATQGDPVAARAAAAAARAKQLAEALKAAQAERAARTKSAATPGPAHNQDGKTGEAKPATSAAGTAAAKTAPARTPNLTKPVAGAPIAGPVNGQQQKPNGHDKPKADISAIHIPGTELGGNKPEPDQAAPKRAVSAPAPVTKQPGVAGDKKQAMPTKPAPGVTVTVTPGANPQEELEAALKALSQRAPAPPAPDPAKTSVNDGDTHVASPGLGSDPTPAAAASTRALDELPSLEPVTPANQKDCPNCTALLPMETKRCRCGFRFPEIEETMPGLSLSDSDLSALDGDTPSTGITHLS